jgi:hypothetical protein
MMRSLSRRIAAGGVSRRPASVAAAGGVWHLLESR